MENRSEDHVRLARAPFVETRPGLRALHHDQSLNDLWSSEHGEGSGYHRANIVTEQKEGRDGERGGEEGEDVLGEGELGVA